MAAAALYLDECVHPRIAVLLRKDGFDILTAQEAGTLGLDDDGQLEFATRERRILISFDAHDFAPLTQRWALEAREHAGVFLCVQQPSSLVCQWIKGALTAYEGQGLANLVLWLPVK